MFEGILHHLSHITATNMKFLFGIMLMALLAVFAQAVAEQKPVVVSYPQDTPQSVLDKAMEAIKKAVSWTG